VLGWVRLGLVKLGKVRLVLVKLGERCGQVRLRCFVLCGAVLC
jgi:hypothetical protein